MEQPHRIVRDETVERLLAAIERQPAHRNYKQHLLCEALLALGAGRGWGRASELAEARLRALDAWPLPGRSYVDLPFSALSFTLFKKTGHPAWREIFETGTRRRFAETPRGREGILTHPVSERLGGPADAVLIDSAQDFLSRAARVHLLTRDATWLGEFSLQLRLHEELLRNPETGLWSNGCGWIAADRTAHSPGAWSRGHGWLLKGLTESLLVLPPESEAASHARRVLGDLAAALAGRQARSGTWHALLQREPSESPPDSSGTALIAAALSRSIRHGWIAETYRPIVRRAFEALVGFVGPEGTVLSCCPGPGPLQSEAPYRVAAFPPDEPHGAFALLHAFAETVPEPADSGRP